MASVPRRPALHEKPDYAPALLNLAVVSQVYLNDPRTALEKYREYVSLPERTADTPVCETLVQELAAEHHVTPFS